MSTETKAVPTDLVILIDTSGSMEDQAAQLSKAAQAALESAEANCSAADVHVEWFGIEGEWPGTHFTRRYRQHLKKLRPALTEADFAGQLYVEARSNETYGAKEDGAGAVQDLARYFNWRKGAVRTLFYLGDEGLKGGDPRDQEDVRGRDEAIKVAKDERVRVFTYFGTPNASDTSNTAANIADYKKLAEDTTGAAFDATKVPPQELGKHLADALETVICTTIQKGHDMADEYKVPSETPRVNKNSISIEGKPPRHWGDEKKIVQFDCGDVARLRIEHEYSSARKATGGGVHVDGRIVCTNLGKPAVRNLKVKVDVDEAGAGVPLLDASLLEKSEKTGQWFTSDKENLEHGEYTVIDYKVWLREDPEDPYNKDDYVDLLKEKKADKGGYIVYLRPKYEVAFLAKDRESFDVAVSAG